MDLNVLGIGAIIGATIVAGTNLFVAQQNRKRDDIRERLEKLFLPIKRVLRTPRAMDKKYETFLEIEKLFCEHEHLASPQLALILDDVKSKYHSLKK